MTKSQTLLLHGYRPRQGPEWRHEVALHHGLRHRGRLPTSGCSSPPSVSRSTSLHATQIVLPLFLSHLCTTSLHVGVSLVADGPSSRWASGCLPFTCASWQPVVFFSLFGLVLFFAFFACVCVLFWFVCFVFDLGLTWNFLHS